MFLETGGEARERKGYKCGVRNDGRREGENVGRGDMSEGWHRGNNSRGEMGQEYAEVGLGFVLEREGELRKNKGSDRNFRL